MAEQSYSHPVPEQLFIPPNALHLLLEVFSGPMDLLLYLIKRHRMDIERINVALISEQYIAYIEHIKQSDFALIAEYLQMAAWLTELKSRALFPDDDPETEEDGDPQDVLHQRIERYMHFRRIAELLREQTKRALALHHPTPEKKIVPHFKRPKIELHDIARAVTSITSRRKFHAQHRIETPKLSVMERMARIQTLVIDGDVLYSECFVPDEQVDGVVVVLLATLSLLKHQAINCSVRDSDQQLVLRSGIDQ